MNAFEEAIYEDMTRKGNSDGIIVDSRSVIPFFMPSLAYFGFIIIVIMKKSVKAILGI